MPGQQEYTNDTGSTITTSDESKFLGTIPLTSFSSNSTSDTAIFSNAGLYGSNISTNLKCKASVSFSSSKPTIKFEVKSANTPGTKNDEKSYFSVTSSSYYEGSKSNWADRSSTSTGLYYVKDFSSSSYTTVASATYGSLPDASDTKPTSTKTYYCTQHVKLNVNKFNYNKQKIETYVLDLSVTVKISRSGTATQKSISIAVDKSSNDTGRLANGINTYYQKYPGETVTPQSSWASWTKKISEYYTVVFYKYKDSNGLHEKVSEKTTSTKKIEESTGAGSYKDSNGTSYNIGKAYTVGNTGTTLTLYLNNSGWAATGNESGSTILNSVPSAPLRTGYTFDKWIKNGTSTEVTSGMTVTNDFNAYGSWTGIKYSIKFSLNGGSGTYTGNSEPTKIYGKQSTLSKWKDLYKYGYKFSKWKYVKLDNTYLSPNSDGTYSLGDTIDTAWVKTNGTNNTSNKAVELEAVWEPINSTIKTRSFLSFDSEVFKESSYTYNISKKSFNDGSKNINDINAPGDWKNSNNTTNDDIVFLGWFEGTSSGPPSSHSLSTVWSSNKGVIYSDISDIQKSSILPITYSYVSDKKKDTTKGKGWDSATTRYFYGYWVPTNKYIKLTKDNKDTWVKCIGLWVKGEDEKWHWSTNVLYRNSNNHSDPKYAYDWKQEAGRKAGT